MIFRDTGLEGLVVIELELEADERGGFARTFDASVWKAHGMAARVAQCNLSRNDRRGTLRGLHYQPEPQAEAKLVRCSRGAIYDVAIDLRRGSPSFRSWYGLELSAANDLMLFIPEGLAHGFLTLTDDTEILYQMSAEYVPGAARGVRWNDPAFGIEWPEEPILLSDRDRSFPDFDP